MILSRPPQKVSRQSGQSDYDVSPLDENKRMPPIMHERLTPPKARPATRDHAASTGSGGLVLFFLVIFGVSALGYYSVSRNYLLGQILAVSAGPLMLFGVWRGGLRKAATLAAMIGFGAIFTSYPGILDGVIASPIGQCAAISFGFIVTLFVVGRIAKTLRKRWVEKRGGTQFLDRAFGAGIGLAEAALAVLTIAWMTSDMRPFATHLRDRPDVTPGSMSRRVADAMIQLGHEADSGEVGRFVHATNPIGKMPVLRDAIQELNHTGRLPVHLLDSASLQEALKGLDSSGNGLGEFKDMIGKYEKSNKARTDAYQRLSNTRTR